MHDKEHIPLLRGTFRALPLERLNFVESRATDENFVRNLGISHIGLLNRCVSSVVKKKNQITNPDKGGTWIYRAGDQPTY